VIHDGGEFSHWTARAIDHARACGLDVRTVGERGAFLRLLDRVPGQLGQKLTIEHEGETRSLTLPLIGAYQAANALVAAGLALSTGMAAGAVFDALEAAIAALRPHVADGGRLIVVFGAGGDRDPGKRGPMGDVAARAADLAIVTDDNPRGEDPAAIRAAILAGAGAGQLREIADRRAAIAAAIGEAGERDIVLIAGKGHEQGQIIGSGEHMRIEPFDDVEVARQCAGQARA